MPTSKEIYQRYLKLRDSDQWASFPESFQKEIETLAKSEFQKKLDEEAKVPVKTPFDQQTPVEYEEVTPWTTLKNTAKSFGRIPNSMVSTGMSAVGGALDLAGANETARTFYDAAAQTNKQAQELLPYTFKDISMDEFKGAIDSPENFLNVGARLVAQTPEVLGSTAVLGSSGAVAGNLAKWLGKSDKVIRGLQTAGLGITSGLTSFGGLQGDAYSKTGQLPDNVENLPYAIPVALADVGIPGSMEKKFMNIFTRGAAKEVSEEALKRGFIEGGKDIAKAFIPEVIQEGSQSFSEGASKHKNLGYLPSFIAAASDPDVQRQVLTEGLTAGLLPAGGAVINRFRSNAPSILPSVNLDPQTGKDALNTISQLTGLTEEQQQELLRQKQQSQPVTNLAAIPSSPQITPFITAGGAVLPTSQQLDETLMRGMATAETNQRKGINESLSAIDSILKQNAPDATAKIDEITKKLTQVYDPVYVESELNKFYEQRNQNGEVQAEQPGQTKQTELSAIETANKDPRVKWALGVMRKIADDPTNPAIPEMQKRLAFLDPAVKQKTRELHQAELQAGRAQPEIQIANPKRQKISPKNYVNTEGLAGLRGKPTKIRTPRGQEVEGEFRIIEADQGRNSFHDGYSVHLQDRDTDKGTSREQIERIRDEVIPSDLVTDFEGADVGAPIYGINDRDGQLEVEIGNHRDQGIREGYAFGNYNTYRDYLAQNAAALGFNPEDIKKMHAPKLIRVRTTQLDPDSRTAFANSGNNPRSMAKSAAEIAMTDAKYMGPALSQIDVSGNGEINTPANREFFRQFLRQVATPQEQNRLVTRDGSNLTQEGLNRIKNAIFAAAYNNNSLVERLADSTDERIKRVLNGMIKAASDTAQVKHEIDKGQLYDIQVADDMAKAADKLAELRTSDTSVDNYLSQGQFFDDGMTPESRLLLAVADKAKSADVIADIMTSFNQQVKSIGDPRQGNLLGDVALPSKESILDFIIQRDYPEIFAKKAAITQGPAILEKGAGESGLTKVANKIHEIKSAVSRPAVQSNRAMEAFREATRRRNSFGSELTEADLPAFSRKNSGGQQTPSLFDWLEAKEHAESGQVQSVFDTKKEQTAKSEVQQHPQQAYVDKLKNAVLAVAGKKEANTGRGSGGHRVDSVNGIFIVRRPDGTAIKDFMTTNRANAEAKAEALSKETASKVTQENPNVSFKPESNISDQTTIKQAIAETKPETETTLAKPEETIKQSVTKSVYTVKPSNGGFAIIDPEGKQFSWGTNRETIENRVSELNKPTNEAPESAQPESGISKVVAAAKSAIEEDKKQPTPQPGKIEDFGEKISGARKHLYGMFVDKMKDVTPDDIKTEPLSKTWPVPDYEKMLQAGESEVTVSWIRALREALPLKPRQTYQLRDWLQDMTSFRKLAVDLASGKITEGDVLTAGGFSQLFRKARDIADLYKAVGHKHSLETAKIIFAEHFYKEGKKLDKSQSLWSVNFARTKTKYSNWGEDVAFGKTRAEAIEEFKKAYDTYFAKQAANEAKRKTAKSSPFTIYKYRHGPNAGKFTIGTKAGSTYIDFRSFETGKEALEFREQHSDELNAWLKKLKEIPAERGTANAPRVGADHRSGKDVTPEQFSEAFGFRGVQFGNWVEDKRRQKDLNDAYDGLMDLAGILNIPSKAISLNSELGLAFGARGIPNASAHYESDFVVINLTKESGAGSLAHEWWHALDNYFSRMSGSGIGYMTKKTSGNTPSGIRVEMFEAFKEIMAAIGKTDQINRSKKLDRFKSKDYWGTPVEYSARAFESYLVNELAQQGVRNDYLANVTSENGYDDGDTDERYPYLKKAELDIVAPAFRGFFKTVKTKETEKGVALYSRKTKSDEQFREKLLAEQKLDFHSTKSIEVCQTPEILRKVGAPDKPITIHPNVIYKAITGKHDLDIDRLWKLPSAIENPIMVFDSKTQPNSLVVVTEIRDKKNKTVIVAIHLTTTESWHKVNAIASVYGKNDEKVFLDWLQKGYGRYINMKKASEWARPLGLQLPVGNSIREASKKIVIDPGNDVKGEDNQEPDNSNAFYSQKGKRPEETKAETSKVTSEKLAELERIIADETKDERFVGAFQAMPAETLTDGAMISQILKDVFGKNLVVFKSNHPNGAFFHGTVIPSRDSKTIFIKTSTDKPATIVAGHELLHLLKADAPDLYQQLTNDLEGLIKDFPTFKTRLAKLSGKATEDSTAKEELFGDFLGDQMADKAFWGKVTRKNPNAFKRIAVLIQEMFAKLKNWLTKNDYGSSKFFSDIEAAQEAFSSTLANYSKRHASGTRMVANAIKSATGQKTENGGLGKVANAIKNAYSYAGQKAAGFKEAEKSGKTFAGPYDGKPRFELDDSKARWNEDALRVQKSREVALRLDQVFNHHELFKSYPDLAGIRTRINIGETVKEPMGSFIRNHYDPETRETIKPSIVVWARNLSDAKQVLLHEIQHAIQEKEGFARGGTPKQFEDESVSEARKRVANSYVKVRDDIFANASPEFRSAARLVNRAHDIKFGGGEQSEEYYQARKEFVEKFGEEAEEYLMNSDFADQALRGETNYDANGKYVFPRDRFEQYHSLAGEIEARDVEFRSDLSAQERLEYPPFESADVNPEDAIVRYSRSKKSKSSDVPIIEVEGHYFTQTSLSDAVKTAKQWYKDNLINKEITNIDSGATIKFDQNGLHGLHPKHLHIRQHLEIVRSLPNLVENAIHLQSHEDRKNENDLLSVHRFGIPIKMDGRTYAVKITAKEYKDGNLYYDHALTEITETKNPDLGSSTHQNDMQSKIGRGSRTNISDLLTAVNLTNQPSADEANDKKRKDRRDSIGRSSGNPNPTPGTDNDPELSAPRNSSERSSIDKNSSNDKKVKFSHKEKPVDNTLKNATDAQVKSALNKLNGIAENHEEISDEPTFLKQAGHFVRNDLVKLTSEIAEEDPAFLAALERNPEARTAEELLRDNRITSSEATSEAKDQILAAHIRIDNSRIIDLIMKYTDKYPEFQKWLLKKARRVIFPFHQARQIQKVLFMIAERIYWNGEKMVASPGFRVQQKSGHYVYSWHNQLIDGDMALKAFNELSKEDQAILVERAKKNEAYRQEFVNKWIPRQRTKLGIAAMVKLLKETDLNDKNPDQGFKSNKELWFKLLAETGKTITELDSKLTGERSRVWLQNMKDDFNFLKSTHGNYSAADQKRLDAINNSDRSIVSLMGEYSALENNYGHFGYVHHDFEARNMKNINPGSGFDAAATFDHPWFESISDSHLTRTGKAGMIGSLMHADIAQRVKEIKADKRNDWMASVEDEYGLVPSSVLNEEGEIALPAGYDKKSFVVANFGKRTGQKLYLPSELYAIYKQTLEKGTVDPELEQISDFLAQTNNAVSLINQSMLYHTGKFARDLFSIPFHIGDFLLDSVFKRTRDLPDIFRLLAEGIKLSLSPQEWNKATPESFGEYSETNAYQDRKNDSIITKAINAIGRESQAGSVIAAFLQELNLAGAADLPIKRIMNHVAKGLAEKHGLAGQERRRFVYKMMNEYAFDTSDLPWLVSFLRGGRPDKWSKAAGVASRAALPFVGYITRLSRRMIMQPFTHGVLGMGERTDWAFRAAEITRPIIWMAAAMFIRAGGLGTPPEEEEAAGGLRNRHSLDPAVRTATRLLISQDDSKDGGETYLATKGFGHLSFADSMLSVLKGRESITDFLQEIGNLHPIAETALSALGLDDPYSKDVPLSAKIGRLTAMLLIPQSTRYGPDMEKFWRVMLKDGALPDQTRDGFFTGLLSQLSFPVTEAKYRNGKIVTTTAGVEALKQVGLNKRVIPFEVVEGEVNKELVSVRKVYDQVRDIMEGNPKPWLGKVNKDGKPMTEQQWLFSKGLFGKGRTKEEAAAALEKDYNERTAGLKQSIDVLEKKGFKFDDIDKGKAFRQGKPAEDYVKKVQEAIRNLHKPKSDDIFKKILKTR